MAVCVNSAALNGIDATIIYIETRITPGVQYFIIGLPDESVKESLIRVESAIQSADLHMPRQKIVISMAPAGIRKQGAFFDLPIALSILAESEQIDPKLLDGFLFVGELSLNGKLRPVKGALSMAIEAKKAGFKALIVPETNAAEAAIVSDIKVYGMADLSSVYQFLTGKLKVEPASHQTRELFKMNNNNYNFDFSEIKGQQAVKHAMEIAAAGGHNIIMIGPPGSGKTMLARRLQTIMPLLTLQEALEVTRVYSISGRLETEGLISCRPFRAPHHTASDIAMVGGGAVPQPGEISLAHGGVLFLDELPEFQRRVLEVLRQPLEERRITVSRANYISDFPAGFLLVAAMNPCPCGYYRHPSRKCTCSYESIKRYISRISGPLLDRIDLHIHVEPVNYHELGGTQKLEDSKTIRQRVTAARDKQHSRSGNLLNAQIGPDMVRSYCELGKTEQEVLLQAIEKYKLSARSYDRILKVARTIADLAGTEKIGLSHLSEAISFRCFDKDYFA